MCRARTKRGGFRSANICEAAFKQILSWAILLSTKVIHVPFHWPKVLCSKHKDVLTWNWPVATGSILSCHTVNSVEVLLEHKVNTYQKGQINSLSFQIRNPKIKLKPPSKNTYTKRQFCHHFSTQTQSNSVVERSNIRAFFWRAKNYILTWSNAQYY